MESEKPKGERQEVAAASEISAGLGENTRLALAEAVKRLYFDESSDYEAALWRIVELLGGADAVALLENDQIAAYEKYCRA